VPVFSRSFATQALTAWDAAHAGNAVRALFERWALPGEVGTSETPLRLAVRDGYLNFYVKGQSVAKLLCGRNGPQLSVHEAYVEGRRRSSDRDGAAGGQSYRQFDAATLADPSTTALIPCWIDSARSYASAEKCFVDDLVAANAGVLDLEMGLPASDLSEGRPVAPRMDLVIADTAGGEASIAFWEAKCANNGELRSSRDYERDEEGSFTGPKVLDQLAKYVRWMKDVGRVEEVRKAYRDTAAILLALHQAFASEKTNPPACIAIWRTLSQASEPSIILPPGLVIGNYWPEGYEASVASGRMAQAARSFERNGHRQKLEREGICVHEVGEDGPAVLPSLRKSGAAA
jgi:hypothetical protein